MRGPSNGLLLPEEYETSLLDQLPRDRRCQFILKPKPKAPVQLRRGEISLAGRKNEVSCYNVAQAYVKIQSHRVKHSCSANSQSHFKAIFSTWVQDPLHFASIPLEAMAVCEKTTWESHPSSPTDPGELGCPNPLQRLPGLNGLFGNF